MPAATLPIVMNIALAALFATSYLAIAVLHPTQRAAIWFALSYFVGMLTPIGMLGLGYTSWTLVSGAVVFFGFAGGLLLMVPSLAVFYGRPRPWGVVAVGVALTLLAAFALTRLDRNTLLYTMTYQMPFMFASAASMVVVLRDSPRQGHDLVLAALFGLTALHFPIKGLVAASLGTGPVPTDYIRSPYALVSQVSTAVLLVATGLTLLINTTLAALRDTQLAAETDLLTGILNRRGFEARAERMLERRRRTGAQVALLLIDIDRFKRVNDTLGHAAGDRTIRSLARALSEAMPASAVVARLGGEEFAALLDHASEEVARLQAEAIRESVFSRQEEGVPAVTVSIGVTELDAAEDLRAALERADGALYAAKRAGRNRVCVAEPVAAAHTREVFALDGGASA